MLVQFVLVCIPPPHFFLSCDLILLSKLTLQENCQALLLKTVITKL